MFKPLNDRILVRPDELKEKVVSGIIITEEHKEKPFIGTVVVGGSKVNVGDRVAFSRFGYDEVEVDNVIHYVISESTILGIFYE